MRITGLHHRFLTTQSPEQVILEEHPRKRQGPRCSGMHVATYGSSQFDRVADASDPRLVTGSERVGSASQRLPESERRMSRFAVGIPLVLRYLDDPAAYTAAKPDIDDMSYREAPKQIAKWGGNILTEMRVSGLIDRPTVNCKPNCIRTLRHMGR